MAGEPSSTIRVRLDVSYDGTDFHGWATQKGGLRTVAGVLEEKLSLVTRHPIQLVVAGRTDAGVHARGQVAHLDLPRELWEGTARRAAGREDAEQAFVRRIGGILGADSDVVVGRARVAPPGFDARFSALARSYEYRLADPHSPPDPLERHRTAQVRRPLDVDLMNAAAAELIGLHDFAGFCRPRPHATTVRTLQRFEWERDARGVLVAQVRADAFCHSMVRSLVGMCAAVGAGRLPLARVPRLLELERRSNEFTVLAAKGLVLVEVEYPTDEALGERQEATRARRPALRLVGDD